MRKFLAIIVIFFTQTISVHADSFLLISSPESYVDTISFFGSGDGIKIIQRQVGKTSEIRLLDSQEQDKEWSFFVSPTEPLVTKGVHKVVRNVHQEKSFSNNTDATLEVSFSTDGRGCNRYTGIARVHEARYTLGKNLRGFAIDILLFGEGVRNNWSYIEIRQNSTIPNTVDFSGTKPPSLEEIEKMLEGVE